MSEKDFVDAFCLVLPTGETLWGEARDSTGKSREDYIKATLAKWKSEHDEFVNTSCNVAVTAITMPRERYDAIHPDSKVGVGTRLPKPVQDQLNEANNIIRLKAKSELSENDAESGLAHIAELSRVTACLLELFVSLNLKDEEQEV